MNLWGAAPLLAAALLGGGSGAHVTAINHTIQRSAAQSPSIRNSAQHRLADQRTSTPTPSFTLSAGVPGASAPSPVLRQVGPTTWETTVLLNDTGPVCSAAKAADYWLATTSPNNKFQASRKTRRITILGAAAAPTPTAAPAATKKAGAAAQPNKGSSCEVRLIFTSNKLEQVPGTAALVINQAGMSSSITLTVSRDVTLAYYLGIPAIVGGTMAVLLFFLSLLVRVYDWDGTELRKWSRNWWARPILGSAAWTVNDSWATNISTGLVVVGTILIATAAANSLFPGVALDRFAIVNIIASAIVVAAPVVFGIYYAVFTAFNPGPTSDATVKLPRGAAVTIEVPSGASITMSGDATVRETDENPKRAEVRAGCTYQVPPGTKIDVKTGEQADAQEAVEAMAFPGTTDIGVRPGSILEIKAPAGTWTIQASDQLAPPLPVPMPPPLPPWWWCWAQPPPPTPGDVLITYPARVDAPGGTTITVVGTADVIFPQGTVIAAPRRRTYTLQRERRLLAPQGTNVLVANMGMLVIASIFTMFGIGAELGVAFVLADFSEAAQPWRGIIFGAIAAVALLVIVYAQTATRTMADPQPGSSISAQAGTSFTL